MPSQTPPSRRPARPKRAVHFLLAGLVVALAGCQSHSGGDRDGARNLASKSADWQKNQHVAEKPKDIWERIRNGYKLQEQVGNNPRIERQRFGLANRPASIQQLAERSGPYIHYIVERLEENGMPLELALLPMIESSYDPHAYSPAQAAGLWQFVPTTGREFNLRQTNWYDGRRDITASTKAAINYLNRLHDMFNGDWLLALAAYNAGEGTVSRAIERNQERGLPTDYWNLPLPRETQDYVPKLLALSQIIQTPGSYGVALAPIANEPYFEKVAIPHHLDLGRVAAATSVDKRELQQLNPAFKQGLTLDGPRHLLVPAGKASGVSETLAHTPTENLVPSHAYQVRDGESLEQIAKRHGVTPRTLRDLNKLSDNSVAGGQNLLVPELPGRTAEEEKRPAALAAGKPARSYRVRKGDTLWSVAKRLDVSPGDLQRWNNLKGKSLHSGQVLSMRTSAAKGAAPTVVARNDKSAPARNARGKGGRDARQGVTYYKVRHGDSLAAIARRFSVPPQHLKSWNPSLASNPRPGQTLTLYLEHL